MFVLLLFLFPLLLRLFFSSSSFLSLIKTRIDLFLSCSGSSIQFFFFRSFPFVFVFFYRPSLCAPNFLRFFLSLTWSSWRFPRPPQKVHLLPIGITPKPLQPLPEREKKITINETIRVGAFPFSAFLSPCTFFLAFSSRSLIFFSHSQDRRSNFRLRNGPLWNCFPPFLFSFLSLFSSLLFFYSNQKRSAVKLFSAFSFPLPFTCLA